MSNYLPLSSIKCLPHLQQRNAFLIDDKYDSNRQQANLAETVEKVKVALNNGQKINFPLEVHEVNREYLLVDGHHRYEGAKAHCKDAKKSHEELQVPVNITKNSTEKAAIDASFKVNLGHGVSHSASELKNLYFRSYVWNRSVPKLSEIRDATGCAKSTASNIANAARWCIERLESAEVDVSSFKMQNKFMTKQMTDIGIDPSYLGSFGLPSYSLLRKALKGDAFEPTETLDQLSERISAVRAELEHIENRYGVEALREGLRMHKTKAHGIKVALHSKWINEPSTASLLSLSVNTDDDF